MGREPQGAARRTPPQGRTCLGARAAATHASIRAAERSCEPRTPLFEPDCRWWTATRTPQSSGEARSPKERCPAARRPGEPIRRQARVRRQSDVDPRRTLRPHRRAPPALQRRSRVRAAGPRWRGRDRGSCGRLRRRAGQREARRAAHGLRGRARRPARPSPRCSLSRPAGSARQRPQGHRLRRCGCAGRSRHSPEWPSSSRGTAGRPVTRRASPAGQSRGPQEPPPPWARRRERPGDRRPRRTAVGRRRSNRDARAP